MASRDIITTRINQDELHVSARWGFGLVGSWPKPLVIDGSGWRRGERPRARWRARRGAMNDFDECGLERSQYLPGCAYYVAPSDFASKPSFLSQPSSCQMTFPYSSNSAPHVQPVREVAFLGRLSA